MQQIKINGKQYPIYIKLGAMRKYCRKANIKLHELLDQFKNIDLKQIDFDVLDMLGGITLAGIEEGLRKEKKTTQHDLVIEDFYDLLEENPDQFNAVIEALNENDPDEEKEIKETDPNQTSLKENNP